MIELTDAQQQELDRAEPARLLDPRTKQTYVLIPTDLYERVKTFLDQEDDLQSVRDMYPHICDVMREDWEDPAMDVYDNQSSTTEQP